MAWSNIAAYMLAHSPAFAVDAGGDIRLGGTVSAPGTVRIEHPLTGETAHELGASSEAIATSGLRTRVWRTAEGDGDHRIDLAREHLAWTGVIQASALAPTALEAETVAEVRTAVGDRGHALLAVGGGALVLDDGEVVLAGDLQHDAGRDPRRPCDDRRPDQQVFCSASRAFGIVAIIMLAVSVGLWMAMSGRIIRRPLVCPPSLKRYHEASTLVTLGLIIAHGGVLLADGYLKTRHRRHHRPLPDGLPAAVDRRRHHCRWLIAIFGPSFYARKWIGVKTWRWLHRWIIAAYLLALAHVVGQARTGVRPGRPADHPHRSDRLRVHVPHAPQAAEDWLFHTAGPAHRRPDRGVGCLVADPRLIRWVASIAERAPPAPRRRCRQPADTHRRRHQGVDEAASAGAGTSSASVG